MDLLVILSLPWNQLLVEARLNFLVQAVEDLVVVVEVPVDYLGVQLDVAVPDEAD